MKIQTTYLFDFQHSTVRFPPCSISSSSFWNKCISLCVKRSNKYICIELEETEKSCDCSES